MHRPTVLDKQNWPDKKPRRKSRMGVGLFLLLMIFNALLSPLVFPPARPRPTAISVLLSRMKGRRLSLFNPPRKLKGARGSVAASRVSFPSSGDKFQLTGGYLEGKEVRTLRLTVQSSLTFSVCRIVAERPMPGVGRPHRPQAVLVSGREQGYPQGGQGGFDL